MTLFKAQVQHTVHIVQKLKPGSINFSSYSPYWVIIVLLYRPSHLTLEWNKLNEGTIPVIHIGVLCIV